MAPPILKPKTALRPDTGKLLQIRSRPAAPAVVRPNLPVAPAADSRLMSAAQRPASKQTIILPQHRHKKKRRGFGAFLSLFMLVAVPTAIAAGYFLYYAADQFVTVAKFSIRSQNVGNPQLENMTAAAGFGNFVVPVIADTIIVTEYLHSPQILSDIKGRVDLRAIYSNPAADWLTRLDPYVSDEALLDYWKGVAKVHYDITTGITTFTVRAFTPEDAQKLGETVLAASETLVNDLSERAKGDVVKLAETQVDGAQQRLDTAMTAIEEFQKSEKVIDPQGEAKTKVLLLGQLEGEIAKLTAELSSLRTTLSDNAPTVRLIRTQIGSLKTELAAQKKANAATTPERTSVGKSLGSMGRLMIEQEASTKIYGAALAGLEQAKVQAALQSRYLVAFVRPKLPDASLYPSRWFSIGITAVVALMAWLFTTLIAAVIREHV